MNRRVKYRKSYTVRTRLSRRSSSAKATAFSNDTVRSCFFSSSTPAAMHRLALFRLPRPAAIDSLAIIATSIKSSPALFNTASAAISSLVSSTFIARRIWNP
ncbi:MAG: hypothetical protein IKK73_07640 [Akkermansia sp.]|nr:hypothetical protein [Akkermansia sp.]